MTISDSLCYFLNHNYNKYQHILPVFHPEITRYHSLEAPALKEYDRAQIEWTFYKKFFTSLDNKKVLDVGCGFGGKCVFYAQQQAQVIGIDIKAEKFTVANTFAKQQNMDERVRFQVADAASLPFASNSFDLVMSNNAMQYVAHPLETLLECNRVVKPSGFICINFGPPWHAPNIPETGECFPWTHLLFSQDTIRTTFNKMGKGDFFKNNNGDIFKSTNHMTIKRYRRLLSLAKMDLVYFKLWTRPFVAPLIYIPFVKEYFCAQVISVSRKK